MANVSESEASNSSTAVGDDLREIAREVLRLNDRGSYTIPAAGLYPFRWLWDSSLIAVGWAEFDEERAWRELDASMSSQWESGMVPHIDFANSTAHYFPGPDVWATPNRSTGITQPPLTALTAFELFTRAKDRELPRDAARALFPKMLALHRWLYDVRHGDESGLLLSLHPWESGLDNSPAWDVPLKALDLPVPQYVRSDTTHADESQRPLKWFYDKCYSLVLCLRELGYDAQQTTTESPYAVADVGVNALAVRGSADLVRLGHELGLDVVQAAEWLEIGEAGLSSLWNEDEHIYMSRDWRTGEWLDVPTSAGFMPLLTSVPSDLEVAELAGIMSDWGAKANHLLPSVSPDHPSFDPKCYWRGPVWANVNWFVSKGFAEHGRADLAATLKDEVARLVAKSGCREYFDPFTGEGLGGRDFSWTAALVLSWL